MISSAVSPSSICGLFPSLPTTLKDQCLMSCWMAGQTGYLSSNEKLCIEDHIVGIHGGLAIVFGVWHTHWRMAYPFANCCLQTSFVLLTIFNLLWLNLIFIFSWIHRKIRCFLGSTESWAITGLDFLCLQHSPFARPASSLCWGPLHPPLDPQSLSESVCD